MGKEAKTNAMRLLERNKIPYEVLNYECDEFIDGLHTAEATGAPVEQSFKTLVMQGTVLCLCGSDRGRGGSKGGGKGSRREVGGNDPCERYHKDHGICPRGMQPAWNEKSVPYHRASVGGTVR